MFKLHTGLPLCDFRDPGWVIVGWSQLTNCSRKNFTSLFLSSSSFQAQKESSIDKFHTVLSGQPTPFCFLPIVRVTRNCKTRKHQQLRTYSKGQTTLSIKPCFRTVSWKSSRQLSWKFSHSVRLIWHSEGCRKMRFVVSSFFSCAARLRYLIFIRVLCRTVVKRYIWKRNVQWRVWSKLSFERRLYENIHEILYCVWFSAKIRRRRTCGRKRPAWKRNSVPAWTKNVMFLWDFVRLPSAMCVV